MRHNPAANKETRSSGKSYQQKKESGPWKAVDADPPFWIRLKMIRASGAAGRKRAQSASHQRAREWKIDEEKRQRDKRERKGINESCWAHKRCRRSPPWCHRLSINRWNALDRMKRPKRPSHLDLMSFKSLCRADKTLITRRAERREIEKEKGMKERMKERKKVNWTEDDRDDAIKGIKSTRRNCNWRMGFQQQCRPFTSD